MLDMPLDGKFYAPGIEHEPGHGRGDDGRAGGKGVAWLMGFAQTLILRDTNILLACQYQSEN